MSGRFEVCIVCSADCLFVLRNPNEVCSHYCSDDLSYSVFTIIRTFILTFRRSSRLRQTRLVSHRAIRTEISALELLRVIEGHCKVDFTSDIGLLSVVAARGDAYPAYGEY